MKTSVKLAVLLGIIAASLNLSCSSIIYRSVYPTLNDGKYDSEFPYNNASKQLDEISNSLVRINSVAFYKAYIFADNSRLKLKGLTDSVIQNKYVKTTFVDRSSAGTGTIIYNSNGTVGLLTCAHVVNFKDTLITYFSDKVGTYTDEVQSIAFKSSQSIYVAGFPEGSNVNEILSDKDIDVAILGRHFGLKYSLSFPVFSYPLGNAKELEWGSFVYVFGFPLNYKMLTTAIVSSPNYDQKGSFFIDAVINRGCSGGIVLAVRDGVPNFELVGIVEWVPENSKDVLVPASLPESLQYNPLVPYTGEVYVEHQKEINYGITKVISIETIKDFLLKNKDYLINKGYYLSIFHSKTKNE